MPNSLPSQPEIQAFLAQIEKEQGFSAALNALYEWALKVGYLTLSKLNDNLRYTYWDASLNIAFKTQINIARSRYTPQPLRGKNIPSLHCPICFENIGLPGKENLRVFEFLLSGKPFFAQLTPFPLYPKHFVLISKAKTPMIMNGESITDMLDFLHLAPSYSVFSNSDVEGAGASIPIHHHYQAIEDLKLPLTEAALIPEFSQVVEKNTRLGLLNFPIAACLIQSTDSTALVSYGEKIIQNWRAPDPKNTCNLALHQLLENGRPTYFLYIIFRNPNFRTPAHLTPIKSEGVGIIEVAGEGIYPVPTDPQIAKRIETDGLSIIKGIIEGNNPVNRAKFKELFEQISQ